MIPQQVVQGGCIWGRPESSKPGSPKPKLPKKEKRIRWALLEKLRALLLGPKAVK